MDAKQTELEKKLTEILEQAADVAAQIQALEQGPGTPHYDQIDQFGIDLQYTRDAWLWKLDCEFRRFNFVGDTHWMRGRVTRKYLADHRPAVDLDIWGENQRGDSTVPGHATVLLPSREHGAIRLPDPPGGATTCQATLDALVDRFATTEAT